MLVLTRKLQQQIKIGEQITVTILKVKGNTVRVGISAPRDVRVVRGELPKEGATTETGEVEATAVEQAAITIGEQSDETVEVVEEVEEVGGAVCRAGETPTPRAAAHLPLRRIRKRFGAAPLKQVLASCSALAK
jgi:carbon storage regulator CsrA